MLSLCRRKQAKTHKYMTPDEIVFLRNGLWGRRGFRRSRSRAASWFSSYSILGGMCAMDCLRIGRPRSRMHCRFGGAVIHSLDSYEDDGDERPVRVQKSLRACFVPGPILGIPPLSLMGWLTRIWPCVEKSCKPYLRTSALGSEVGTTVSCEQCSAFMVSRALRRVFRCYMYRLQYFKEKHQKDTCNSSKQNTKKTLTACNSSKQNTKKTLTTSLAERWSRFAFGTSPACHSWHAGAPSANSIPTSCT